MKNRTLLGQILTVVIYLYNTAAVGLVVVMIAGLIGSNSIADKYEEIEGVVGVSSVGAILSFLFVGVVWFVFYFILKKVRNAVELKDKDVLIEAYNSFLERKLLGQILTIIIYLYNIAAAGLLGLFIYHLIFFDDSNSFTESIGFLWVILISVGCFYWVIHKVLQLLRDEAGFIDKESISNKKDDKGSLIEYFSKRKKNTVLFIILGLFNKVLIHFLFYTMSFRRQISSGDWIGKSEGKRMQGRYTKQPTYEWNDNDFGEHISVIFEAELILFIPAFLSLSFIVWYFNDKIKAK